jgi:glycosyltransferase involved in cell wall biosynthesis
MMSANVLVLTPIYPWVANPHDAVFVQHQVRNLTRLGLSCRVLSFRYCPRGVPASLWWMRYARRLETRDSEAGFPVHDVFVPRHPNKRADVIPRVVTALVECIERTPALLETDVVYAHWLWPGGAAALRLRDRFGWPVAAIARGSEMHYWQTVHPHCRPYVQRVIQESDRVLANCAGLRKEARELVSNLGKRIDVAYNGCDTHRFVPSADKQAVRRKLGFRADAKLMLFCGSIIERKGIRNLARGWATFCEAVPDWQLVVVGRLGKSGLVRNLARTPRVTIVGPVHHRQIAAYMQAADAYVQPSVHEGLANATMEAMATGLPVIATDTGGQGELIADGRSGLLIPVEDSAALSDALVRIATGPGLRRTLGASARDTIVNRFSERTHAAALASVLNETAALRSAKAREAS